MRGTRRWRRVVKWGLLACAVGVAVLAIASYRWVLCWESPDLMSRTAVFASDGVLQAFWAPGPMQVPRHPPLSGFDALPNPLAWKDRRIWSCIAIVNRAPLMDMAAISLWIPFVLTLGPFLYLWHTDRKAARRARAGACASCGYDRVGLLAGAACPECGALPKGAAAGGGTS